MTTDFKKESLILLEGIDLQQYTDLFQNQKLIAFTRDIALKTNEIIYHMQTLSNNQKEMNEKYENKIEQRCEDLYQRILQSSKNEKLKIQNLQQLQTNQNKKLNLREKFAKLDVIAKRQAFRVFQENTQDILKKISPIRKMKNSRYEPINDEAIKDQIDLKYKQQIKKILELIQSLKANETEFKAQLTDLKYQIKYQNIYQQLTLIEKSRPDDKSFLQTLFNDMKDISDSNLQKLAFKFDKELQKVNVIVHSQRVEQEQVIAGVFNQLNKQIQDFQKNDITNIKEDMHMLFVKINHANDSHLQVRKEISEIKKELRDQGGFASIKKENPIRDQLREQYDIFVTQQQNMVPNKQVVVNYREHSQNKVFQNLNSSVEKVENEDDPNKRRSGSGSLESKRPQTSKNFSSRYRQNILINSMKNERKRKIASINTIDLKSILSSQKINFSKKTSRQNFLNQTFSAASDQKLVFAIEHNKVANIAPETILPNDIRYSYQR